MPKPTAHSEVLNHVDEGTFSVSITVSNIKSLSAARSMRSAICHELLVRYTKTGRSGDDE